MRMRQVLASLAVILALLMPAGAAEFEQKWVFLSPSNLRTPEGVDAAIAILEQSAAVGCTHALVTDSSHLDAEKASEEYFAGIARFKEKANALGIALVPTIFPSGYGGRYLNFDNNYAAGLPVKDAPFVVSGKEARPELSAVPGFSNGGFEDAEDNVMAGWQGQDHAGVVSFADTETAAEGKTSLKLTNFEALPQPEMREGQRMRFGASVNISQEAAVEPFKRYTLSYWIRTEGLSGRGRPSVSITSRDGRRRHSYMDVEVEPTQDWTEYKVTFNTLDAEEMQLTASIRGAGEGSVWFDGIKLTPMGFTNVIRRERTPVKVTSADGAVVYEEGKDYREIVDPLCDPYEVFHEEPALVITDDSRISDGDTVLVSWYHSTLIHVDQITITISDPMVFGMMERDAGLATKVWGGSAYFMNVDEIRVAGWEEGDKAPSQMLADYTTKAIDILRKLSPDATIYTWSDMYTPFHNARELDGDRYYYLVNGSWAGSWETLPSDVVIMAWSARSRDAIAWFADKGHKQVLCGYYDGDMKRNIMRWMGVAEGAEGVLGMMYTTWQNNFTDMEEFFDLLEKYPEWVEESAETRP